MLNVGGAPASKVYVGSTPAKAVYVGDAKVWPPAGLYAVNVEYLPNYEVRFTARTSYATSAQDNFFFNGPPTVSGFNGFVGRTFTRQWASGAAIECTLEDSYGAGGPLNTITVTVTPKP